MLRRARPIGLILAGVGLAIFLSFAIASVQHFGEFRRARLQHERNPGHAMYDLQFFIVTSRLALLIGGAVGGGLLALNGATLICIGRLAESSTRAAPP
jgi:hypothetical protein